VEEQSAEGRVPGHDGIGTPAWVYNTQAQNLTGHPAITLPAGILPSGLPFGLELTGPRFRDDLLLAVGRAWEEARPWPRVAPGYGEFWTG
jgi:amidase/aspartyl-tRNA(Asn)/glutamyl-tRNA(Gln) amidotransferase subunit A